MRSVGDTTLLVASQRSCNPNCNPWPHIKISIDYVPNEGRLLLDLTVKNAVLTFGNALFALTFDIPEPH